MEFEVNNGRKLALSQNVPDGEITVKTIDSNNNCESEYLISPGDMVMLLNHYHNCKDNGEEICK